MKKDHAHFEYLFKHAPDLLCIADIGGYFLKVNPAFNHTLGYTAEELLSQPFINFIHQDDVSTSLQQLEKLSSGKGPITFENRFRCKNGPHRWLSWKAFRNNDPEIMYAIARDITEHKLQEAHLLELIRLDPLTEVFNRRAFTEICNQELRLAVKHHSPLSLIIVDIDFFKEYNDRYGHLQGDLALKKISKELKKNIRTTDSISRYGGDEFLLLLSHTNQLQAMNVAEHLRDTIEKLPIPNKETKTTTKITVTLGVTTIIPSKKYSIDHLIAIADRAMYQAKSSGRNGVVGLNLDHLS